MNRAILVEVTFGRSTSPNFRKAVRAAERNDGYSCSGQGRSERHCVTAKVPLTNTKAWENIRSILDIAGGWKSTSLKIQGEPVRYLWEFERSIAQVLSCYEARERHQRGDEHCIGKQTPDADRRYFGCTLEQGVLCNPDYCNREAKWYQFGHLSPEFDSFKVDKKEIYRTVKASTAKEMCTHCPAFDWKRVRAGVQSLPSTVSLGGGSPFVVKYSEINPSEPLGIKLREHEGSYRSGISLTIGTSTDEEDAEVGERWSPATSYEDVAGQETALQEVRQVVELPLLYPEYFAEVGANPHRGVILYGPPGNGKTLIVRAVAGESKAHLETINGPEILSKWVGQSEKNLRGVFGRAKTHAPSIVLIDEIDAIAGTRDEMDLAHQVQLISQLLVLLDGLEERAGVAVIATTNRIEAVDPAIRRPGRFDYHIRIPPPDVEGRSKILAVHLRRMKVPKDVDTHTLAAATDGFSGADLAAVCREAGLLAINDALDRKMPKEKVVISQEILLGSVESIRNKRLADNGERQRVDPE